MKFSQSFLHYVAYIETTGNIYNLELGKLQWRKPNAFRLIATVPRTSGKPPYPVSKVPFYRDPGFVERDIFSIRSTLRSRSQR
jgi:hypothetical protein